MRLQEEVQQVLFRLVLLAEKDARTGTNLRKDGRPTRTGESLVEEVVKPVLPAGEVRRGDARWAMRVYSTALKMFRVHAKEKSA